MTRPFDSEADFVFHSTLAYKLDSREFETDLVVRVGRHDALSMKFSSGQSTHEDYHMRYFYFALARAQGDSAQRSIASASANTISFNRGCSPEERRPVSASGARTLEAVPD